MNRNSQICGVLKNQQAMSETVNNIFQKAREVKSLQEIEMEVSSKFQSILIRNRTSLGLTAILIVAIGWLKLLMTTESTYLTTLSPAIVIVLMVIAIRLFEGAENKIIQTLTSNNL